MVKVSPSDRVLFGVNGNRLRSDSVTRSAGAEPSAPDDLTAEVSDLLDRAQSVVTSYDQITRLSEARERLHGPLRVAIAGQIKAGKSTLLNAIVGEELAATDAGECTKIVTWYSWQTSPEVTLHRRDGTSERTTWARAERALDIELRDLGADQIDHIEVGWPTKQLQQLTIMDTPGIASISATTSARTHEALETAGGRPPLADAVLYLMRHVHAKDVRFLESFHDDEINYGTPMNSVGVLSRSDEIGSCELNAMQAAARIARRYQNDPRMRRLCPIVVPVSGLLAFGAGNLREKEYRCFAALASAPAEELAALTLTVDRFAQRSVSVAVTDRERAQLLQRFGMFGVRLGIDLIRSGTAHDSTELAAELRRRSGLDRLKQVLTRQFEHRSRVLKARSALAVLSAVLDGSGGTDAVALLDDVERIHATRHEFAEVRLLTALRSQPIALKPERLAELDRLLGGSGHDSASRLSLPPDADPEEIGAAARDALSVWQRLAEHPVRSVQVAARTATRTLEGLIPVDQGRSG